jgi:hypothetical protein
MEEKGLDTIKKVLKDFNKGSYFIPQLLYSIKAPLFTFVTQHVTFPPY